MKQGVLLLIVALLLVALTLPVAADERTVTLRIEGADDTLFYSSVVIPAGNVSVLDVLKLVDEADNGITIEGLSAGYITAINGERAGRTASGWDGFGVRLGGHYLSYDKLSTSYVFQGNEIVVYYADEFGAGLMIPQVDDSALRSGTLRFFAEVPLDGGYSVEPIVGAEVRWYCGDAYVIYMTDKDGRVKIDDELLFAGEHRVAIDLKNEEGVPLVLRLSPGFAVNIPTDVGDSPMLYVCIALVTASAVGVVLLLAKLLKAKRGKSRA